MRGREGLLLDSARREQSGAHDQPPNAGDDDACDYAPNERRRNPEHPSRAMTVPRGVSSARSFAIWLLLQHSICQNIERECERQPIAARTMLKIFKAVLL